MCLLHSAGDWPGPTRYLSFWSLLRYLQDRDCTSSFPPPPSPLLLRQLSLPPTEIPAYCLCPYPLTPYFLLHLGGSPSPCMDPPSAVPILPSSCVPPAPGRCPTTGSLWLTGQHSWPHTTVGGHVGLLCPRPSSWSFHQREICKHYFKTQE